MAKIFHGNLFIVAAPSGGGKTSLVKQLVQDLNNIEISISHTTRDKRVGEEEARDYFFVKEEQFKKMVEDREFLEHAYVFDHFYGTSKQQIMNRLESGIDVLLDIDWQGAQQIKAEFTEAVTIFVIPPSLEVLKQRLQARKRDNEVVIQNRMQRAQDEMSHYQEFEYLIVNEDFKLACKELEAIVIASRLKTKRQAVEQRKLLSFLKLAQ